MLKYNKYTRQYQANHELCATIDMYCFTHNAILFTFITYSYVIMYINHQRIPLSIVINIDYGMDM